MTIELHALKRIRLRAESTFATDMTSAGTSFTSFLDVPAMASGISLTLNQQMLSLDTTQQFVDGQEEKLVGIKSWSLSFTTPLAATGVLANTSTTSVTSALGKILTQALGAESLSAGSTVASGGSTTGCVVTGGHGSRVPIGSAIGNAPVSAWELREVLSLSTDTITTKMAFTTTMSGAIARSATYYLTEPAEAPTTLQFAVEGVELDDRFILLGGRCTLAFGFAAGQVPTVQVTVTGNYWFRYTSGDALAAASYTNYSPIAMVGSELHVATVGSTAQALQSPCMGFTLNLNTSWIPLRTPGGVQTEFGLRRGRSNPVVSGSWTIPYQNDTYFDSLETYVDHAVFLQIGGALIDGTKGSGAVLISCPTVQIVNVQRVDADGVAAQQISFEGRSDNSGTPTTSLARSAFRVHLF